MAQAHQRTAALCAAIQLDVFRAVGQGPGDAASIARHCEASERGIRILCDFLVINGVLAKDDGHYKHTPSSAAFLDPVSPACMASVAQFLAAHEMTGRMQYLLGSASVLARVWSAWGVGSRRDTGNPELVAHTALVYGITAHGRIRTIYSSSFAPSDIVRDVPRLAAS